jgi:tRNA dimethylallyltransferase
MKPPLIVVVGPTGVGKSETALQLAERLDGEIVSADSRLFYRGMDIGTAKPSQTERERVPHHLIDVTTPDQVWSLAVFQQEARRAIAEIHARGRLPLLVGGTGQYVRAVTQEWEPPQVEPNLNLRQALQSWADEISPQGLHARLALLDPQAANVIDARNLRRTLRALEVILTTGHRFSEQRRSGDVLYRLIQLGISRPRQELYARIDARIQAMLDAGLVGEVQDLLSRGYTDALPPL